MKKKLIFILKILAAAAALGAVAALCVWLVPLVLSLREPEVQEKFRAFIESLGVFGVLVMLAAQILQIIVAVIPGEPIEIMMGLMYGTAGGLILTLAGIAAGQTVVFFAVKRFGIGFAKRFVNVDKFMSLSFLREPASRDRLIFLLFFIPGTPKDVLTYFAPFTGIGYLHFIVLSTAARIPSVVSSTFAGASLGDGNLVRTVVIFVITGAAGLVGIWLNDRITKKRAGSAR